MVNEPFQNELRQISVKNLLEEGGRHSVIQRPPPCHNRQKPPLPPSHGRLNGRTTRLFHHNERRLIFGGPMGHRSLIRRRQRCKNPIMHSLVGGREIAISTGLSCSGQMGALGLKRGLPTEVEKGPACLSEQRRNLQSLERISGTGKMCCCRDGSRKLHASWIDARRSRGGFQLRTISLQRRAKSFSTHQGASCTDYITF